MTTTELPPAFTFEGNFTEDPDTVPPSADVEYPCEVCGRESGPYGGRGRKPKRCPDHKRSSGRGTPRGPGAPKSAVTLADQATEALWQINGIAAFLAMMAGYPQTAGEIQAREQSFREMAHAALLTDPGLCRFILKGGIQSGKASLILCYAMFGMGVAPALVMEVKQKRAEKQAAQDAWNDDPTNFAGS